MSAVSKLIPKGLRDAIRGRNKRSANLRVSVAFDDIGSSGPLISVFEKIKDVPGWFNVDDCGHFSLILAYQSAVGLKGDLFEIGSYHGRSTAVMATRLQPDEKVVVCDAFESDTDDPYANRPSLEKLIANIKHVNPGIQDDQIDIRQCLSNDLTIEPQQMFRFIHVDGGHSAEQAYFDLNLCCDHLLPGGVLAMDDYDHRDWPGVTEGTDKFLAEHPEFSVVADLNRHGALGRKLYLTRQASA